MNLLGMKTIMNVARATFFIIGSYDQKNKNRLADSLILIKQRQTPVAAAGA